MNEEREREIERESERETERVIKWLSFGFTLWSKKIKFPFSIGT